MKMQRRQFRIGELAKQLGVERFVVRFWEKEFQFNAQRSHGGQRFYEEKDLEKFLKIKELLYEQGFTISGAKKQLKLNKSTKLIASKKTTMTSLERKPDQSLVLENIKKVRVQLVKLKNLL